MSLKSFSKQQSKLNQRIMQRYGQEVIVRPSEERIRIYLDDQTESVWVEDHDLEHINPGDVLSNKDGHFMAVGEPMSGFGICRFPVKKCHNFATLSRLPQTNPDTDEQPEIYAENVPVVAYGHSRYVPKRYTPKQGDVLTMRGVTYTILSVHQSGCLWQLIVSDSGMSKS